MAFLRMAVLIMRLLNVFPPFLLWNALLDGNLHCLILFCLFLLHVLPDLLKVLPLKEFFEQLAYIPSRLLS
jgi:hypothetical protein